MEVYHCLLCELRFEKEFAQPVRCPRCQTNMVYWKTAPYQTAHPEWWLPKDMYDKIVKNDNHQSKV